MKPRSYFVLTSILSVVAVGQEVSLRNVPRPHTAIESRNIVEIKITGGARLGTVTVVLGFNPPYVFGTTDGAGNWSVQATQPDYFMPTEHTPPNMVLKQSLERMPGTPFKVS